MAQCTHCFREKNTNGACPFCGYDGRSQAEKYPLALKPGSILNGRYIVGHVIGQGGFGITYIAQDHQTKERVAIKEYLPMELASRGADGTSLRVFSGDREENFLYGKEQFLAEAKTLAAFIGDEHIVRIHSYFEENGTAYFVMDYVDGPSLDKYMKQRGGRLSPGEAGRLLLPLMESLGRVHEKGIVHRDIAPDNILIENDASAKLIDFGAARYSTGEKSRSLDVILKHGFAPYEQYMRRGRQGPWTDVYALAATFYYAITEKVPPEAIERRDDDLIIPPSNLGADLNYRAEEVLGKALEVQAKDRYQSMAEFHRDMAAALTGELQAERAAREQERLERERQEQLAREEAERQERERREKEERKAAREAAKAERQTTDAGKKKKTKLPVILAVLAAVALGVFGIISLGNKESPVVTEKPEDSSETTQASSGTNDDVTVSDPGRKDEIYELKLCHVFADESSGGHESRWINKAVAEVEEKSGGSLKIDCFPEGVMGSESEVIPQVFMGTADMSLSGPSVWGTVGKIDAIGWPELPYIVDNYAQMNALAGILPDLVNRQLEEAGIDLYCLGAMSQGMRCLCTTERHPVNTADDCKDLRIRVPMSETYMATVESWGCEPINLNSSKVVTSLVNEAIDGFESDPASILARGQQEGFHWYIETCHIASWNLLMINRAKLEKLPADLQEILIAAFREKCMEQCYDRVSANEADLEKIKAAGVEVITPSEEAFAGFKAAAAVYRDSKIAEWGIEEIFAEAQASTAEKGNKASWLTEKLSAGDMINFGSYEQDNDTSNGKEPIEWLVLDKQDDRMLVISRYALDCQPFNTNKDNVTWESCSLRAWLNEDFVNEAFNEAEQDMIPTMRVSADKNPRWGTSPGNDTWDRIFLLSVPETEKYFDSNEARQCKPTIYTTAQGCFTNPNTGTCGWWLRSPGSGSKKAEAVSLDGSYYYYGETVDSRNNAVRPAMWIDLTA